MSCSTCQFNAIKAISLTTQTVAVNGVVNFTTNYSKCGCLISHNEGSPTFTLEDSGVYLITFHLAAEASDSATTYGLSLFRNGDAIPGATATCPSGEGTVSLTTLVKVLPSCRVVDNTASITLVNDGANEIAISIAELDIVKIG